MEISISDFMSTSGKRNGSNWEHLKLHLAIGRRNASNPATSLYVFPLSPVYPPGFWPRQQIQDVANSSFSQQVHKYQIVELKLRCESNMLISVCFCV